MIILIVVIILILVGIYDSLPFWVKLLITVLSFVIPDPIPALDEFFLIYKLIGNISKVNKITNIVDNQKNNDADKK